MKFLALDIGSRRTGVAYGDSEKDFIMAKDTIAHVTTDELLEKLGVILREMKIDELVLGIPLLPGGGEGEQALYTKNIGSRMTEMFGLPLSYIDERFSSPSGGLCEDPNAVAACTIMNIALQQRKEKI